MPLTFHLPCSEVTASLIGSDNCQENIYLLSGAPGGLCGPDWAPPCSRLCPGAHDSLTKQQASAVTPSPAQKTFTAHTSPAPVPHTCPVHQPPRKDRQRIPSPAALRLPGDRSLVRAVPGNCADRVDVSPESLPRTRLEKCPLRDRFQTGRWDKVGGKLFKYRDWSRCV